MSPFPKFWQPNIPSLKAQKNIRGLVKALNYENMLTGATKSNRIRVEAADALGEIGDVRTIEPLLTKLTHWSVDMRRATIKALGAIGDLRAIDPLLDMLGSDTYRLMTSENTSDIVKALVKLGAPPIEPLIEMLNTAGGYQLYHRFEISLIHEFAIRLFVEIGDVSIKPLVQSLRDESAKVRRHAAKALDLLDWTPENDIERASFAVAHGQWDEAAHLGSIALDPLMIALNYDEDYLEDYKNATRALVKIGSPSVEPLIALLKSTDSPDVAAHAATALIELGDPRAMELLSDSLLSGKFEYSILDTTLAKALGNSRDPQAINLLITGLKNSTWSGGRYILDALTTSGEAAVEALVQVLGNLPYSQMTDAVRALESIGWKPKTSTELLCHYITHQTWYEHYQHTLAGGADLELLHSILRDRSAPLQLRLACYSALSRELAGVPTSRSPQQATAYVQSGLRTEDVDLLIKAVESEILRLYRTTSIERGRRYEAYSATYAEPHWVEDGTEYEVWTPQIYEIQRLLNSLPSSLKPELSRYTAYTEINEALRPK